MPKRGQLFAGLSPHSPMFDPSAVQVGLAVGSETPGQIPLREFKFSSVTSQMFRTRVHPPTVGRKCLSNRKRLLSVINPKEEGNMFFHNVGAYRTCRTRGHRISEDPILKQYLL